MTVSSHVVCTLTGLTAGVCLTVYALGLGVFKEQSKKLQRDKDSKTAADRGIFRAISEAERHNFLTGILAQLWSHVNVAGCEILRESIETESLKCTQLDLGTKPLQMQNIVVRERTKEGVQFEADVVWDAECQIQMKQAHVGSFGVSEIKFRGRMAFWLRPLTDTIPLVEAVQAAFLDPPTMDLKYTGLAKLAGIKGISGAVKKSIADAMARKVVLPAKKLVVQMNDATSFLDIYQPPLGVVRITLIKGRGFQIEKRGPILRDDIPDVYCNISIGTSRIWKTATVDDSLEPVWPETEVGDFILYDYGQHLTVDAWDRDSGPADPDDHLGTSRISIRQALLNASQGLVDLPLSLEEEVTTAEVTVKCELLPLSLVNLNSLQSSNLSTPYTMGGVLTVVLGKACNIPEQYRAEGTFVRVLCGNEKFETDSWPSANPTYNVAFHIPLFTESPEAVELFVYSSTTMKKLGQRKVTFHDLIKNPFVTENTRIGNGISLEYRVTLHGLETAFQKEKIVQNIPRSNESIRIPVASSTNPEVTRITPSAEQKTSLRSRQMDSPAVEDVLAALSFSNNPGATAVTAASNVSGTKIRLTAVQGRGFAIQKARFRKADIPDVYLVLSLADNPEWTSQTIDDCCEPVWNESSTFSVSNRLDDPIQIDAWDRDSRGADDFLGTARVTVGKLLLSAGGQMELELADKKGKPCQCFVTLQCTKA